MRYYNEKWDRLVRASSLSNWFNWNVTDRAAVFDEELFQEEYKKMEAMFIANDYDKEKQKEANLCTYQGFLKDMEEIPEYIKNQIADIRVLALGTVTEEVLHELKLYSEKSELLMKDIDKEYQEHYGNTAKHMSKEAAGCVERSFHDSRIIDCGFEGSNLFFMLKLDGGYDRLEDQYTKLILKDATVLDGEINKDLCSWICHELYYENGYFELHVRFSGGNIIVQAVDICSEYLHSFFASDTALPTLTNDEVIFGKINDLIASGKLKKEETTDQHLREMMEDEAYGDTVIMISKNFDSLGKLTICDNLNKEKFDRLTDKKFIYDINFGNYPSFDIENMISTWTRGDELLQYMKNSGSKVLELWIIWTDRFDPVDNIEYKIDEFDQSVLESVYKDTVGGIGKSRKITIQI